MDLAFVTFLGHPVAAFYGRPGSPDGSRAFRTGRNPREPPAEYRSWCQAERCGWTPPPPQLALRALTAGPSRHLARRARPVSIVPP
jgi:hypothetical protein